MTHVNFPTSSGLKVNMMPIVMGDYTKLPKSLHGYIPLIEACSFEKGSVVYLTVDESKVIPDTTQRRGGVHTEGFNPSGRDRSSWGGGTWGGSKGLYMASTDGACRIWEHTTYDVNEHGAVNEDLAGVPSFQCEPSVLYWMTDATPHEALPSKGPRQFFRLVSEDVSVWFDRHNTENPLGVQPGARRISENKFDK